MNWIKPEINNTQVTLISSTLKVAPLFCKILLNRGISIEQARLVINDYNEAIINPLLLNNALEAAKSISNYCKDPKANIFIFGDYDCDGVTSTYIVENGLKEVAKCNIESYLPERAEGYGLNMDWAKSIVDKYKGTKTLIITVDNGIAQVDEIKYLMDNKIEVIVTDHHTAKEEVPDCLIVCPHNHNEDNTFKHLAGVGVAFKVVQLVQNEFNVHNMFKYTPYVAIGTIADMMPMTTENIAFVKYGLSIINSELCPESIKAFKRYMGKSSITAKEIGWELGPRINSCGRLNNTTLALDFLNATTSEEADKLFLQVEKINTKRKSYSDKAKKMIKELDLKNSTEDINVLNLKDYPTGVVGIIAGEVQKQTGKASIVVTEVNGNLVGSARGIEYLDLYHILKEEKDNETILNYGGHKMASGLSLDPSKFEDFKLNINNTVKSIIENTDMSIYEVNDEELRIDEELTLTDLNEDTFNIINELPYNNSDFQEPIFAITNLEVAKTKCSKNNPNNICFTVRDGERLMDIWAWGFADTYKDLGSPKQIHLAGNLERNFMSPKNFTLKVQDILGV